MHDALHLGFGVPANDELLHDDAEYFNRVDQGRTSPKTTAYH